MPKKPKDNDILSRDDSEESSTDINKNDEVDVGDLPDPTAADKSLLDNLGSMEERSELDKIFEQMLDPANIHHYTELSQEEINAVSAAKAIAENPRYQLIAPLKYMEFKLQLQISKNRGGRKEVIKIAGRNVSYTEEAKRHGFMDRFR